MNPSYRIPIPEPVSRTILTLLFLLLTTCVLKAADTSTNQNEVLLGKQVLRLLDTRDTARFARELCATFDDWQSVRTNALKPGSPGTDKKAAERGAAYEKEKISASARQVIDLATRLGLDSSHFQFTIKEVLPKGKGTSESFGAKVPWASEIKIILAVEPKGNRAHASANKQLLGECELSLGGSMNFPTGWRTYEGIRWTRFPEGATDAQTMQDMKLISAVASRRGALTKKDDPALTTLGETFIRLLQKKDVKTFANEATLSFDEIWKKFEKEFTKNGGEKPPSKQEFKNYWTEQQDEIAKCARTVLDQAEALGIDFATAKITLKDVLAKNPYARGGIGSVDGIEANSLHFTFTVESDQKSKTGRPISGEYKIATEQSERNATRWTLEDKIRWEEFPKGLLDEKELADMTFENYVAEHNSLPPGTMAPDVEMTQIDNDKKVKLSDLRGKVVVIDFWATWCGPCQQPMAHLQTLREHNPDWKDRVAILSLSIDDDLKTPRKHLTERGWTNSVNMWAGSGGWESAAAKKFYVTGVPTLYVLDTQGKVIQAGHPLGVQVTNVVNLLLK